MKNSQRSKIVIIIITGCSPRNSKDAAKEPEGQESYYISIHILNGGKARRKNLAMTWIDYKKAYYMGPLCWRIHYQKMYKISNEVIKFIEKTKETCRVELTAGGKSLAEAKTQWGIFQGHALSPLLSVITMIPLNHILRKYTGGYKLKKSQEKINYFIYMDDVKLCAKKQKKIRSPNTDFENILSGYRARICIEKCTMLIMKSGKRHITERIETY